MIDDSSAIIVQALAFTAAEILHKEESSVSSRDGRIAVGRVWHLVHKVYHSLGDSYFQREYRMSYESFWNLHTKLVRPTSRDVSFLAGRIPTKATKHLKSDLVTRSQ